jgi:hypothetical protein
MDLLKSKRKRLLQYVMLAALLCTAGPIQAKWLTIHNDFNQFDLDGNSIQTRSGCLCKFNDAYYWYGSAMSGGWSDQKCYSSTDLLHWTYKGVVIKAPGTNRMDVLYNDSTKQYVMFLKTQVGANCDLGYATCSTPDGQYVLKENSKVFGSQIGDPSVWKDDDGKAYFLYVWDSIPNANSGGISQHALAEFAPDYLSLTKRLMLWPVGSREAPMMMKHHGLYYYMTSLTLWITSTATQYYTAPTVAGPWTTTLVPMITPGNTKNNSWDTQCDFVYPFKGPGDTVYMYCGDRWERPDSTRCGDYVWLPIKFSPKDSVVVDYYQDWEVDPDKGIWRPLGPGRNLALHKKVTASSVNGSHVAANITDSSTWQNYMNTRWTSEASDPQWVMVDLGAAMDVNRVILKWDSSYAKSFQVQVSMDNSSWKDVFSTTKNGARSVTDETFATVSARYVRMYGTQRGNTSKGYSLFDFMVLNDSLKTPSLMDHYTGPVSLDRYLYYKESRLRYSVPHDGVVKIDVVDVRGKTVAVLVNGIKQAGDHEIVLSDALSSGLYIVRISVNNRYLGSLRVRR